MALGFLVAGCTILFASAVNYLVLSLIEYSGFFGLLKDGSVFGSILLNSVILNALDVVGFFFVFLGVIKLLTDRTVRTQQSSTQ